MKKGSMAPVTRPYCPNIASLALITPAVYVTVRRCPLMIGRRKCTFGRLWFTLGYLYFETRVQVVVSLGKFHAERHVRCFVGEPKRTNGLSVL